jgi:hypothetical protein
MFCALAFLTAVDMLFPLDRVRILFRQGKFLRAVSCGMSPNHHRILLLALEKARRHFRSITAPTRDAPQHFNPCYCSRLCDLLSIIISQ